MISMADAARRLYGDGLHEPPVRVRWMRERGTLRHYWQSGRIDANYAVLVRRSEVAQVQQHQHEN
jgi:hypothetical protein